jgi:hypothetical protein
VKRRTRRARLRARARHEQRSRRTFWKKAARLLVRRIDYKGMFRKFVTVVPMADGEYIGVIP